MISDDEPFSCTQCGECCKGFGGTYVTDKDIAAIAEYIGISEKECLERYCVFSGRRLLLGQKPDGYCLFFEGNCRIHPVKPRMCRDWPYIDSVLVDIGNWHIMAANCPGMRQDMSDDRLRRVVKQKLQTRKDQSNPSRMKR